MSAALARNYTIIIDKSGSMSTADVNGKSRWLAAQESTLAIARHVEALDPDGLTVYFFSGSFKRHDNVKSDAVEKVFKEHAPLGSTALHLVLEDALAKAQNPETILVITDGEPDDRQAVEKAIVNVTNKIENGEELAISFFQVGSDASAQKFLQGLDDDIKGAKFDIVDTKTFTEIEAIGIEAALLAAIND